MPFGFFEKTVPSISKETILSYADALAAGPDDEWIDIGFKKKDIIAPDNLNEKQQKQYQTAYYNLALNYAKLDEAFWKLAQYLALLRDSLDEKNPDSDTQDKITLIQQIISNIKNNVGNLKPTSSNIATILNDCFPQQAINDLDKHRDPFLLRLVADIGKLLLLVLSPILFVAGIGCLITCSVITCYVPEDCAVATVAPAFYPWAKKDRDGAYFSLGDTNSKCLVDNVKEAMEDATKACNHIATLGF